MNTFHFGKKVQEKLIFLGTGAAAGGGGEISHGMFTELSEQKKKPC